MPELPEADRLRPAPATEAETWRGWRERCARMLEARTGEDLRRWNQRMAAQRPADEPTLRAWLTDQGVTGYPASLLVWERFGYPDFIAAGADELIDGQYKDRLHLRPILDAILAALPSIGQVTIQARKTYVSLASPRRTFAVVQATSKSRVDLGLRLAGHEAQAGGRLQRAKGVGNGSLAVRIGLSSPEDVDEEALGWLRRAYNENSAAVR